jgi:molybdenum cofactor cytidylyltransferase
MTALIILAAGESSRLGQPKQNLVFKGKTLLQHAVDAGLESECATVIVVLGANSKHIMPIPETATLYNKNWKEGMASSIKTAMLEIDNDVTFDQVIIMVCDQPFVSAALLNAMIDKQAETKNPIIACSYKGTTGVPVLFNSSLFGELLLLKGKEGAKRILKDHAGDIAEIIFEKGGIDIDTPEDHKRLQQLSD